jgi:hypothetical protein
MKTERKVLISPREKAALAELQGIIREHYPAALFSVRRGVDDPAAVELWTTVDVEDTDLLLDHVIDRVMELQIEDGLPVHVIPVRPRARVLAMRKAEVKRAVHQTPVQP